MDIATRVARGAALLDERIPDWRTKVGKYPLDTASVFACVLGQLAPHIAAEHHGYYTGLEFLGLGDLDAIDNGFVAESEGGVDGEIEEAEYEALDAEWARVIAD